MFKAVVIGDDEGDESPRQLVIDDSPSVLNDDDLNRENDLTVQKDTNGEGMI